MVVHPGPDSLLKVCFGLGPPPFSWQMPYGDAGEHVVSTALLSRTRPCGTV